MKSQQKCLLGAALTALCAVVAVPQQARINVSASQGHRDERPFGKYLLEICTIEQGETASCARADQREPNTPVRKRRASNVRPAREAAAPTLDQTISIELTCNPAQKTDCNPPYPVAVGSDFFVRARSDSGLPVYQKILSGFATPYGGGEVVRYRATAPGQVVIRASVKSNSLYSAAAPIDLILRVKRHDDKSAACTVLPQPTPATSKLMDAPSIVNVLGNPTPFVLAAPQANAITIYTTREPLRSEEQHTLAGLINDIRSLTGRRMSSLGISGSTQPFQVQLKIPHALALGDLTTRLNTLNYSQFTIQDVGRESVRITAAATPDCATWTKFLENVKALEWHVVSQAMNAKLYYLSSSDVQTAFSGLAAAPSQASSGGSSSATGTGTGGSASGAGSTAAGPTISITQPAGSNVQVSSDTTPCVVAGLAFGNAGACAPASSGGSSSATTTNNTPAALAPPAMASLAVAAGIGEQNPPDLLVFSDTNPGDDAQVLERMRLLAQLDLPRPEMIISAWVTQNSSVNPRAVGAFSELVKKTVDAYNLQFENIAWRAWNALKGLQRDPGFYNESFTRYISNRFVADTYVKPKPGQSAEELAQAFLDHSAGQLKDPVAPRMRKDLNLCDRGHYCLGYQDLFKGVKPGLTDLLLVLIAAQDPIRAEREAVRAVEQSTGQLGKASDCSAASDQDMQRRCGRLWRDLGLDKDAYQVPEKPPVCIVEDHKGILASFIAGEPTVHLRCFTETAERLMQSSDASATPPYTIGLLRAAVANFLFHYKMSQQYPHEFEPYDLTQSANTLNAALNPLVDAFNRDLTAYQMFVRADLAYQTEALNDDKDERCCIKRLFGLDKPSFFNDGIVSVRTISGQKSSVDTTSQNYLNSSTAPELSSLLNTFAGESTGASDSGSGSGAGKPLASSVFGPNPLARFQALAGVLGQYQTTYAQIGRGLNLQVTPRSLSTASSAEIAVTLNADESAGGPVYSGGGAKDPANNTSRVAQHDVTTRVRVESVKMFEVSSFAAVMQKSRSRFPILPPFVELPYVGTFAGIPVPGAKEYHSSTAILTAYVAPTAADLAYGLRFSSDLVLDSANTGPCSFVKDVAGPDIKSACVFRSAASLSDLTAEGHQALLTHFNEEMVRCLATDMRSDGCEKLVSFDTVPH